MGVLRDFRYAVRLCRRSPGFSIITSLLLALGIAANTIIFSAVDALLLKPLPVNRPEELVRLVRVRPGLAPESYFPRRFYDAIKSRDDTFSGVLAQIEMNLAVSDGTAVERIRADLVSGNFFALLGVPAMYGRVLSVDDEREAFDTLPAVLSYPFWKRRFNADPSVIGRTILLQGQRCLIVGVTLAAFNGISIETSPDLRVPITAATALSRASGSKVDDLELELAGRLRSGVAMKRAEAEYAALWHSVMDSVVRSQPGMPLSVREYLLGGGLELQPLARGVSSLRTQFSNALVLLMIAAGLLMIIVCTNVAGLLLARSVARQKEIAIRVAVGASRGALIRQMMTESALLTLVGASGGLLLAFVGMPFLDRALPPIRHIDATSLPLNVRIEPDLRILGFSVALCVLMVVLFGLGPALRTSRRAGRSGRQWTAHYGLVVAQVALCTFLLTVAGLLVSTFRRLRDLDPGFNSDRVVTFSVDPGMNQYSSKQARALELRLMERVRTLPGVDRVAIAGRGLMRGTGWKTTFLLPGQTLDRSDYLNTSVNAVSPDYYSTMGMRVVAGRNFTNTDSDDAIPRPVVVNQAFVRRFFSTLDPIGQIFGAKADFRIIGVVSDARYRSLREPVPPTMYKLWGPHYKLRDPFILHVRTRARPESTIGPVREILRELDPHLPIYEMKTLAAEVQSSLWRERLMAALASMFAAVAALLTVIGIYGLLSYTVARRTREIGVRIALGASAMDILSSIVGRGLALAIAGVTIGLAAALVFTRMLESLLFGVSARDPLSFFAAAGILLFIAAATSYIPARRALRIDPMTALRSE